MPTLAQSTLDNLGPAVAIPRYDRAALRPGIVHFGIGNFHRVHQAVYVDRCLHAPGADAWGISAVELIDNEGTRAKAEAYRAQNNLYSVSEFAPDGTATTRVIGAIVEYLHAAADPEAVLARLAHPDTRIVSLTITEGGYNIDEQTGRFLLDTPDVAHDLGGSAPRTVFGFIVGALKRRRAAGLQPFTIMSCDNLRHNGDTARLAVVSFAQAFDADLATWIDKQAAFPNSMVDRIAPQVPEAVRQRLNERSGIDDKVPALSESFMQWVLEDHFTLGRPAFETVGVEIRGDVTDFEFMKMRILNASHMLLGYPGLLMGYEVVHDAMGDERLFALLDTYVDRDVIPNLTAPSGVSLDTYKKAVLERFSNPAIGDQMARIAGDGAAKFPIYRSKTASMLLEKGSDIRREAFFLACFGGYLRGRDDKGGSFPVFEPHLTAEDHALLGGTDPLALLKTSPFVNLGFADNAAFAAAYRGYVNDLATKGAAKTLEALLAETA